MANISKKGIATFGNIAESGLVQYVRYDNNVYIEPDGSAFIHIAHHNNPASIRFESSDTFTTSVYKDPDRWFNVSICNNVSKWEFVVKQRPTDPAVIQTYRWTQFANPMVAVYEDVTANNITRSTSSEYTASTYGGIYALKSNTYIVAVNGTKGNWFGAIGCWNIWSGGLPGINGYAITTGYIDLYLRVDNLGPQDIDHAKITKYGFSLGKSLTEF